MAADEFNRAKTIFFDKCVRYNGVLGAGRAIEIVDKQRLRAIRMRRPARGEKTAHVEFGRF